MAEHIFRGRGYLEHPNFINGAALNIGNSTPFQKEFPVGEGWYKAQARFNITLTVGTGTTPISEGELLFIKKVFLKTDRGEILCNLPGRAIYKIGVYLSGQTPRKDAIAAANGTYRVNLPIYFADPRMMRPEDTILNTARYNTLSMDVTLGSVSDLLGVPGTATVAATLDFEVERSLGRLPDEALPFGHMSYDYRQPADASSRTEVDLDRAPDMSIMRLFVHSSANGIAGIPWSGANADDVQDKVTIKDQNKPIDKDRIHAMIQEGNKIDAGLESIIAGVEVFDWVRDGSITSALATGDKSMLQYTWTNQAGVIAGDLVSVAQQMIRTLK